MNDEEIRAAIYQGIREEIQDGINDYVDQKEETKMLDEIFDTTSKNNKIEFAISI